jgi:hypothetical protein
MANSEQFVSNILVPYFEELKDERGVHLLSKAVHQYAPHKILHTVLIE